MSPIKQLKLWNFGPILIYFLNSSKIQHEIKTEMEPIGTIIFYQRKKTYLRSWVTAKIKENGLKLQSKSILFAQKSKELPSSAGKNISIMFNMSRDKTARAGQGRKSIFYSNSIR